MRLLLVNQHYPPDSGATGKLARQLSEELVSRGHDVTILTGRPTYEEARGLRVPRTETRAGVRVVRVPLLPRRDGPVGRLLHYLSFSLALLARGPFLPRPDLLIAFSSTPVFGGAASRLLARLRRCPFVYVVQDVYPEMALALGVLRPGWRERATRFLEARAWRGAARVVLIGKALRKVAASREVDETRLRVIPNWEDPREVRPVADSPFRRKAGIGPEEFVVEYAGNLGRSQDLESVLAAARIVEERAARPVRFLFVGSGCRAGELARAAAGVRGVTVLPWQPEERLSDVLGAADLALVPLRRGLGRYCVPSKVYSILASGRPAGCAVDEDSDVARIVEEAECGFRVDPGDPEALAREILRLADDPGRARRLGENGRVYGEGEGSLARAAGEYADLILQTIAESRRKG